MKPPGMPTAAEVRAKIVDAERAFLSSTIALGEALVVQFAIPDRDVSAEQAAVDAAKLSVIQLKAMRPIIEKVEAAALAGTRAMLAADQRKRTLINGYRLQHLRWYPLTRKFFCKQ
jgi:hypothetical protein